MPGSIFLERGDELVEMKEEPWEAEARLQELLSKYPNLLAGDQMNELTPRQWLLVSREFGIPGEIDAAGRWSLDHLFLDQDSIPTLVEVKRSSDTRIRREVVGQMLDYASHLVTNVSGERIRQRYEASLGPGIDSAIDIASSFGANVDVEGYWQRLNDNIAASKLRLVFVADEFPPELRRIVEFLNRQMQQTDVFAVEVRQFVSPDRTHRTLVPRLLGKVESKTSSGSGAGPGPRWDRARFEDAAAHEHPELLPAIQELLRFGVEVTERDVEWGMGRGRGSFTARLIAPEQRYSIFSVYTSCEVSINLGWSYESLGNLEPSLSEELRQKANHLFGIQLSQVSWERGWPMVPLSVVAENMDDFKAFIVECKDRLLALQSDAIPPSGSASTSLVN